MSSDVHPPPLPNSDLPSLTGLVGALEGRRLLIDGPRVVLGRDATSCQLVLEHALISRQHAAFETDADRRVLIRDLGSTQGTFVNGVRVELRELAHGDRVGFGREGMVAFRFDQAQKPAVAASPSRAAVEQFSAGDLRARLKVAGEAAARIGSDSGRQAVPLANASSSKTRSDQPLIRIGRAPDNDLVLESRAVSRYHASITYAGDALPRLSDTGSTNGTFLNGEPVRSDRSISPRDLIFLGGFLLRVDGRKISRYDLSSSRLTVRGVSKHFGERKVLQDISFAILPREFVGLMGPSGCGKSTLMDALNGLRPASAGTVSINDLDLYRNFDAVKRSIGYVPQRDILHDALSVERTLYYAARLRLPDQTPVEDLTRVVDEAITTVGLGDHRTTAFHQLSGGQQKRLSLALELLTKPSFLFLDEPTSPLDPETSENLMMLFRKLADEGRIVVMVTHKFEKFDQMHQIALLTKGGKLAFFGPPKEALNYFACGEPSEIYRQVAAKDPDQIDHAFRTSPQYQAHIVSRHHRIAGGDGSRTGFRRHSGHGSARG